ncbi:MAG: hypothetical protein GC200_08545 [Tepidisphaera sp.]|nr:hypothetical protein [Tepidisphaera sp.]
MKPSHTRFMVFLAALMPACTLLAQPAPAQSPAPASPASGPAAPPAPSQPSPTLARVPGSYWSIMLPPGWEEGSPEELDLVNEAANDLAKQSGVEQHIGFKMLILPEHRDGRYLLVQEGTTLPPGLSFESISKSFDKAFDAGAKRVKKDAGISVGASKSEPDAVHQRILTRSHVALGGPDTLGHFTLTSFAREGVLSVHAYAPAKTYAQAEPSMLEVANSIAIDAGHEYAFGTRSASGFDWSQMVSKGLIGGLIGLVFGLGAWLKRRMSNS